MTTATIIKYLTAQAELNRAEEALKETAQRQIAIMKEIIERADLPELKSDRRLTGLFSFDYIKIEVFNDCRVSFSVWEEPAGDWGEENVGEFELSKLVLNGAIDNFRREYEAYVAQLAEAFCVHAQVQRDAEIARTRKILEQLERQRAAALDPIRSKA